MILENTTFGLTAQPRGTQEHIGGCDGTAMGPDMEVLLRLLMNLRVLYYERSLARLHQKVPDLADADAALEPATWSAGGGC